MRECAERGIIAVTGGGGVYYVGKLDKKLYSCVTENILTDDVIITDERIQHIKDHHPGDFERFVTHMAEMIKTPDYILQDDHENTAMVLKEIVDIESSKHFRLALRLVAPEDSAEFKNSILTFMKVREKEYNRVIRNKKILYKKE